MKSKEEWIKTFKEDIELPKGTTKRVEECAKGIWNYGYDCYKAGYIDAIKDTLG